MSLPMLLRFGVALLHAPHPIPGPPPMQAATASWYDDAGQTACGFHARYGFASLILRCGARVLMRGPAGTAVATMQDHGPYVAGRTFDLNPPLRWALGCGDICTVTWRPLP